MQCAVCGQSYGLTHACPGIAAPVPLEETGPSPRLRFDPLHYFSEAFKILRWDDAAVRRASRDNNALLYGFVILLAASALPFVPVQLRNASLGYAICSLGAMRRSLGFQLSGLFCRLECRMRSRKFCSRPRVATSKSCEPTF